MNNELIDRYLKGICSVEERLEVLKWAEESEENRISLLAQHRIYDASLVYEKPRMSRSKFVRSYLWPISVAAVVALAICLSFFYLETPKTALQYAYAQTEIGEQKELTLSDGTSVLLNSGSSLEVLETSYEERRVRLSGEAYFNVTHDPERPFIVETSKIQVKVLGTSFNVHAYTDDQSIVLLTGLVNVVDDANTWTQYLSPNFKFSYNAETGKRIIEPVDADNCISWREGYLTINQEPLSEVLDYLRDFYNVNVKYDRQRASTVRISGKLELRTGLEDAINSLSRAVSMDYTISDNEVELSLKK